ncbi:MAG: sigma-54-dependent Fis family transcriptional regulator [Polyangiaceae bacterium]|nr:sigma-54-dependent Fis family transcriptional regulator [Polyangiaceae bacterium]
MRFNKAKAVSQRPDVLVLEDDASLRSNLATNLRSAGLAVVEAETCEDAVRLVREEGPSVIVTDLNLPDGNALGLLPRLRRIDAAIAIFVITAYGTIDVAVRAVKGGAENVLTKPIDVGALVTGVRHAIDERGRVQTGMRPRITTGPFMSTSPAMRGIEAQVERLRDADCSVLILGETGTGKSVLARRIHRVGARGAKPFVDVNCAGLSRELVESELFGHERGAFTGAQATKEGLFDSANGGSLFLDEIGDIDLAVQPKILKVLEDKRFRRMGDVRERAVDVRLLAATHQDLLDAIENKTFRADLFYRISTVTITIPSLKDRPEDVLPLTRHVLGGLGAGDVDIADDARDVLLAHPWPGNIRELKNVIERAVLLRSGDMIQAEDLRFDTRGSKPVVTVDRSPDTMKDLEREHIVRTLTRENGRVEAASRVLGIPRSTLYQKLRTYQIDVSKLRKGGGTGGDPGDEPGA